MRIYLLMAGASLTSPGVQAQNGPQEATMQSVALPTPTQDGERSLEEVLAARRSIRDYTGEALHLAELSQLLWAAQGVTSPAGNRATPSAGALYPLELFVVAAHVDRLEPGVYRYRPEGHRLEHTAGGDRRRDLAGAALGQEPLSDGAAVLVFTAVVDRTTAKYGERGIRYVHMEVGHAAQNVYLQATSLGLGTVIVGAFHDAQVARVLDLEGNEWPFALMPVGRR